MFVASLGLMATAPILYLWPGGEERFTRSALGRALAEPMTAYVAAIARPGGGAEAAAARREVLSRDVAAQIGPEALSRLEEVLDLASSVATASTEPRGPRLEAIMKPLFDGANAFNRQMEVRGIPAFIRPYARDSSRGVRVWVTTYVLRDRADVEFAGTTAHVVWGRRLDELNLDTHATIFKDDLGDAFVLSLEHVEARFLDELLPSLARDAPPPCAESTDASSSVFMLGRGLVRSLQREYSEHTELTQQEAIVLDELVGKRDAAVARLRTKDGWVHEGGGLLLAPATRGALRGRMTTDPDVEELFRRDDELSRFRGVVASAVAPLASVLEESWVVYRLESERLAELSVPVLAERGADEAPPRAWLSSRLAMLARPRLIYTLAIIEAAEPLVAQRSRGAEKAAAALFGAIFPKLGLAPRSEWMSEADTVQREAFAAALARMLDKPHTAIQAAAASAYLDVFGAPAPEYRRTRRMQ